MTIAELRRAAREAEQQGRHASAACLRHQAEVAEAAETVERTPTEPPPAADPLDLSGLTMAELIRTLDRAFEVGMAATAELSRREGDS